MVSNTDAIVALRKLRIFLPSCSLFLLSYSIEYFVPFLKTGTPEFSTPILFSELILANTPSVWLTPQYE